MKGHKVTFFKFLIIFLILNAISNWIYLKRKENREFQKRMEAHDQKNRRERLQSHNDGESDSMRDLEKNDKRLLHDMEDFEKWQNDCSRLSVDFDYYGNKPQSFPCMVVWSVVTPVDRYYPDDIHYEFVYLADLTPDQDLLHRMARHISNPDQLPALTWGVQAGDLLAEYKRLFPDAKLFND